MCGANLYLFTYCNLDRRRLPTCCNDHSIRFLGGSTAFPRGTSPRCSNSSRCHCNSTQLPESWAEWLFHVVSSMGAFGGTVTAQDRHQCNGRTGNYDDQGSSGEGETKPCGEKEEKNTESTEGDLGQQSHTVAGKDKATQNSTQRQYMEYMEREREREKTSFTGHQSLKSPLAQSQIKNWL